MLVKQLLFVLSTTTIAVLASPRPQQYDTPESTVMPTANMTSQKDAETINTLLSLVCRFILDGNAHTSHCFLNGHIFDSEMIPPQQLFQSNLFNTGVANFTLENFTQAGYEEVVYRNLETIAAHERTYVDFLTEIVVAQNLTPSTEQTYAFPAVDPKSLLEVMSTVKRVAIATYVVIFLPSKFRLPIVAPQIWSEDAGDFKS